MAAVSKTPIPAPPLADLRSETAAHLEAIKGELDEAVKDLDALESIGLDVTKLRERVDWGYKAREVVMKRFGKTP
jgi:transposase-like protein